MLVSCKNILFSLRVSTWRNLSAGFDNGCLAGGSRAGVKLWAGNHLSPKWDLWLLVHSFTRAMPDPINRGSEVAGSPMVGIP